MCKMATKGRKPTSKKESFSDTLIPPMLALIGDFRTLICELTREIRELAQETRDNRMRTDKRFVQESRKGEGT